MIILAVAVYVIGWSGAMAAIDANVKDRKGRTLCEWPIDLIGCPMQFVIAGVWPVAVIAGPVFHLYRNEQKTS